jgi:glycyl-tRNA synthetase beta chain
VQSGNTTNGHRRFGKSAIKVTISNYEARLLANHVVLGAAERRSRIVDGLADLLADGLRVKPDEALLDTLTYLTEFPAPILGGFDQSYLSLPEEVLVTVMRHHQKYFSVETANGSLAPHFVAVMNVPSDPNGYVRAGNERVLRARFNDARFFYEVDQKRKLIDRVEDLRAVTYQKQLGEHSSYWHKTQRNVALTIELGGDANARRAALLAKCDLTCEMVKEFTELQGVVGGLYCRAQGEPEEVAAAVYDHYKPVSMEDAVPRTECGQVVALADKLDTLRECFRIGLAPTGSRDPFALRRAAQGVLKILVEGQLETPLIPLLNDNAALVEFFEDRVRYYFREVRGHRYDEVNATIAAGWSDLKDLARRIAALAAVRPTQNFEPLAASFKRIRNILKQSSFAGGPFTESLLEPGPERDLHDAVTGLALTGSDYHADIESIATLRPQVDLFFDKVLVNAQDPAVRANRLALLDGMLTKFSKIADFSEIVTATA